MDLKDCRLYAVFGASESGGLRTHVLGCGIVHIYDVKTIREIGSINLEKNWTSQLTASIQNVPVTL
jgi:hypothetical protein